MKTINFFRANTLRLALALLIGLLTIAPAAHAQKSANTPKTAAAKSQIAQSINRQEDPIRAEIIDGRVRLTAKKDLDWPTPSHFVEGLQGRCVGLFVGDIGQETNPFLCMLMDDGGVELLSYQSLGTAPHAYYSCPSYTSSGRLPELKDIIGFCDGTVGDEFASYVTIFAIDRGGRKHEIEPCVYPGQTLYHDYENDEYNLLIYPDWTLEFTAGWVESGFAYTYIGRLRPIKTDYENGIFEYRYNMLTRYDYPPVGDDEAYEKAKPVPSTESGSFRLTRKNDEAGYDLTILSGDPRFFVSKSGHPAHYTFSRYEIDDAPAQ